MRALVQRVRASSVKVDGETLGEISGGLTILLGVTHGDTEKDMVFVAEKCANLRIFCDDEGKMNRSLLDVGGEALVISQFTLYGDCRKGRRPSFGDAAKPDIAEKLYLDFIEALRKLGVRKVDAGRFGADMLVEIHNDGPVTLMVESDK
ncbi:D-aminoacyl-tRNA deacylase [bioreactor metagenome]|uniref:D-aminoacyl-tRNA deacylase n=1 Tax=bioreactor metagenome TaxID=1076179 RepID=A0A645IWR7_9ZZZZ